MPELRSSSRGSMICSGRRLTVAPPSVLAFLWTPNRMPTIPLFMMATLILAKPFSPSVRWCFHCSRDVIAPKKLKWHSFSPFSLAAPVNGVSLFGDRRLPAVPHLWIFVRRWRSFSIRSAQGDEAAAQLSSVVTEEVFCHRLCHPVSDFSGGLRLEWGRAARSFLEGLDEAIADELAAVDLPRELDNLINLALRVEGCLNCRRQRRQPTAPWRHLEASSSDAGESPACWGWAMPTGSAPAHATTETGTFSSGVVSVLWQGWPLRPSVSFKSQGPPVKRREKQTLQLHALSCPFDFPYREVRTLVTPFWIQGLRGISWILPLLWDGTSRPFPWPSPLRRGH